MPSFSKRRFLQSAAGGVAATAAISLAGFARLAAASPAPGAKAKSEGGAAMAAAAPMFYAWVTPAYYSHSPLDHTWVTSYDNRLSSRPTTIEQVIAQHQNYWYCWGGFHEAGSSQDHPGGAIGSAAGDLALATCLVLPNKDSDHFPAARGTIEHYGIDGVCHQLANQVLFATGVGGASPWTVKEARGYWLSSGLYGTYGLRHKQWADAVKACTSKTGSKPTVEGEALMASQPPNNDEFAKHVRDALTRMGVPDKADRLLALRAALHTERAKLAESIKPGAAAPKAEELNQRNNKFFSDAAEILTRAEYYGVFGVEPGADITLVDPKAGGQKR